MTKQYWIDGFFIDLSRNQITQNKQPQTMAPKALAVLTYLAKNQGKVVSQDALLDNVWPNTIVSPNTLQRSIAQLRKALGDDGKVQSYIKTHAKQGYSLECDVRWHNKNKEPQVGGVAQDQTDSKPVVQSSNSPLKTLRLIFLLCAMISLVYVIAYQLLPPKPSSNLAINHIRSLTATDDKEFDASYTPDGKYIVFHRYLDKFCVNHIWAKNIITQKETQLTKNWGAYGRHSFSKDGKKLVFLATEACNQPSKQRDCYDLVTLDFEKALKAPQDPSLLQQCQNSEVKKPIWLNNNDVALLKKDSKRWKLITYSISMIKSSVLFDPNKGNLIDYAYSVKDDIIAVISVHEDGEHYIEMLKSDGQVLSSHPIERPDEIPRHRPISPSFDPLNEQLVFSTGRQLYTLTYDGKVAKIHSTIADNVQQPDFHKDGKKLLMIKGPYDSDIVQLPFTQIANTKPLTQHNQLNQSYTSFERTNLGEDHATFQPDGNLLAFWSERSGEQQIWISDGTNPQQLTQFPMDSYIRG